MRKLMYFTIGFAAASSLCACLFSEEYLLWLAVFAGLTGILILKYRRLALVLLGAAAGLCWYVGFQSRVIAPILPKDGEILPVTIRAADESYETAYGAAFAGTITIDARTWQVTAYLQDPYTLKPGETVSGPFLLRVTVPGGREESAYHQGEGIFLLAYQRGDITVGSSAVEWMDRIAILRSRLREILQTVFPEDTFPFTKALLLGDSSDLDYETDTDFKRSGIRHVIAVSGLHVSILFALISMLTFRKRFLTALLGFPALLLFASLAGFTPSVSRACLMSALMLLGMLTEQEYDGATALAFAVLIMLLVNPLVITSVSFQLSAASVAGIYLFDAPIRKWLLSFFGEVKGRNCKSFIVRWFAASVSVSISAMVFTTPLCGVHFGTVSLVGIATNLLALWPVSVIFYGILGTCILTAISVPAAMWLAKLVSVPIRYVLTVAKIMGKLPLAAIYTNRPYLAAWLIFVYILLVLFLLMRKKRPGILLCCGTLGLCTALLASWVEPMLSDVRVSVLDVGQGQCILVQNKGHNFLVDCGGDSDAGAADLAAETLLSQGITKLDAMILTHLDRDHAGGAKNFLRRVDTDALILPPVYSDIPEATGGAVIYAEENLTISCDTLKIQIFAPNFPGNSNEMSLCILFDTENCDILITGDRNGFGERSLLRNNPIPTVDILIAGHHGSKNSTCEELLSAVRPEIVCISAGADNAYGHPAPELLQRLREHHCTVYRTDLHGTIIIRR